MTTGDEPQLGGQDHDNAPMISGRGTKIIVSARGAYLAGNLGGLIEVMDEDQRLAFTQAVIRRGLQEIRARSEEMDTSNAIANERLAYLDEWLRDPSEENRQLARSHPSYFNHYDPFEAATFYLCSAISINGRHSLERIYKSLQFSMPLDAYQLIALDSEINTWEIEAAWCIIQGKAVPILQTDLASLEARLADARIWYRRGYFDLLIRLMNHAQRERFKQVLLEQAVWYIDKVSSQIASKTLRELAQASHKWLRHSQNFDLEASREILRGQRGRGKTLEYAAITELVDAFDAVLHKNRLDAKVVRHIQDVATNVSGMLNGMKQQPVSRTLRKTARQWQLDTAYAILTDQPIPPLGDPDAR